MYWKQYGASRGLWKVLCLESCPEGPGKIKKTDVSVADLRQSFEPAISLCWW
jgi:hypothetical protein